MWRGKWLFMGPPSHPYACGALHLIHTLAYVLGVFGGHSVDPSDQYDEEEKSREVEQDKTEMEYLISERIPQFVILDRQKIWNDQQYHSCQQQEQTKRNHVRCVSIIHDITCQDEMLVSK